MDSLSTTESEIAQLSTSKMGFIVQVSQQATQTVEQVNRIFFLNIYSNLIKQTKIKPCMLLKGNSCYFA